MFLFLEWRSWYENVKSNDSLVIRELIMRDNIVVV